MSSKHDPNQNHLLAALLDADFDRLAPYLELIPMPLGDVLYESGGKLAHVYFPTTSIVSLHYLLENGGAIGNGCELGARKVFHVSPFCDVTGSYRFRFMRALRRVDGREVESTLACIDYDDGAGALLETSVSGAATALSSTAAARAFFSYPLMTLGVVVRIHLQALRLWLRRVPFFSKPAPPQQKVTR